MHMIAIAIDFIGTAGLLAQHANANQPNCSTTNTCNPNANVFKGTECMSPRVYESTAWQAQSTW